MDATVLHAHELGGHGERGAAAFICEACRANKEARMNDRNKDETDRLTVLEARIAALRTELASIEPQAESLRADLDRKDALLDGLALLTALVTDADSLTSPPNRNWNWVDGRNLAHVLDVFIGNGVGAFFARDYADGGLTAFRNRLRRAASK